MRCLVTFSDEKADWSKGPSFQDKEMASSITLVFQGTTIIECVTLAQGRYLLCI